MTETQPTVPFFKKKSRSRPTNQRQRDNSPSASSSNAGPSTLSSRSATKSEVVLPTRRGNSSLLSAGTKRSAAQRDNNKFDEDEDEDEKDGPDVKWTAAGSHQAFAQDIIAGEEAEAMEERRNKKTKLNGDDDDEQPDDGLYHGQEAYKNRIKKNQEVPKSKRIGPQRNTSSTIRQVTIVDYQPDVCKDYKETGYCGFGDTCKFLHDRGTYLAGWQLDKLANQPKRNVGDSDSSDDSDSDEDIPFACLICRKPYTDPVQTRCGHYFCSACAIKRFAKTPKCIACGAPTGGIFNRAEKVIEKMKKKEAEEVDGDDEAGASEKIGVQLEGLEDADSSDEESN